MKPHEKSERSASILILTLWVLFFLASLTVAAAGHVLAILRGAERLQERVIGRVDAWSAAAWAASVIDAQLAGDGLATNRWDGVSSSSWNRDAEAFALPGDFQIGGHAGLRFSVPGEASGMVGVIGEEGRVHLNGAPVELLRHLFAYLGGERAALLADSLFLQQGEDGLTQDAQSGYDRIIYRSVDDLRLVEGMDPGLFEQMADHLTVYGRGSLVNVNAAPEAVLVAVLLHSGLDTARAEQIAATIVVDRMVRGFESRSDFEERIEGIDPGFSVQNRLTVRSTAFRGIASGGRDATVAGLEIEFVWDTVTGQYVMWNER